MEENKIEDIIKGIRKDVCRYILDHFSLGGVTINFPLKNEPKEVNNNYIGDSYHS